MGSLLFVGAVEEKFRSKQYGEISRFSRKTVCPKSGFSDISHLTYRAIISHLLTSNGEIRPFWISHRAYVMKLSTLKGRKQIGPRFGGLELAKNPK